MFIKFVCHCKTGALCELVCEHLFFLFQQNSCFSPSFIATENFFSPTRITYASVSDIKNMNSTADTPWTFPKLLLAFISPDYRSRISKKGWNFFFFLKKTFHQEKGTVAKSFFNLVDWMIANIWKTMSIKQRNFKPAQKRRQIPSFFVGNNGFFLENRFRARKLLPPFFRSNAVNAAVFPVRRRQCRYFWG